ncbi:hypothetical protein BDZ91DRAFT_238709 [Kalaharituber pfeilii]|nr:hypothetical protein BDZ91DRAFT_238709 [Kalaharituber pfeilii]
MSAPTKATILGKLDMFEVDEVRAAINRFWDERDAENLHAVEEELARVKQHNETLMKKDANMLKKLQEMAKAKIEVEVEAMGLKLELGRMEEKKIKAEQERDQWEAKYDTMKAERDGSGGGCRSQNASPKVGDKVSVEGRKGTAFSDWFKGLVAGSTEFAWGYSREAINDKSWHDNYLPVKGEWYVLKPSGQVYEADASGDLVRKE